MERVKRRRAPSKMLAGVMALGALLSAAGGPLPARASHDLIQDSHFCDSRSFYRGRGIVVDGPSSQRDVHGRLFGSAYAKACPIGSGLVTYLGTGERAGIAAFVDHIATRNFATADIPLSATEWLEAWFDLHAPDHQNRTSTFGLHQIPLYVNVVSVGYSITSCSVPQLNLRSQVLSAIYTGLVRTWNDPLLVQDNPALARCAVPIRVIKRAEFAGSTFTFKDYLSKRNPIWNYYKQPTQNQLWPSIANACPALGEDGMADCIASTQNSIGYIAYHQARLRGIRTARIDSVTSVAETNAAARFIAPSPAGCTAAADSTTLFPPVAPVQVGFTKTPGISPTVGDWSTVSLTDSRTGYPLCSFSYAFIYQELQHAYAGQYYPVGAARTAVDYLWTALSDASQGRLPAFDYGRLPSRVLAASRQGLETVRFQT